MAEMTPEAFLSGWYTFSKTKLGYAGTQKEWEENRKRGCIDLFWLAKYCLKLDLVDSYVCPMHPIMMGPEPVPCLICGTMFEPCPGLIPGISVHREICNAFVHKNPNETLFNQDTKKTRAIFCPRGSFKSSIDMADVVQWVICFPDIRVLIFSASPDLGAAFVSKIREWFTLGTKDVEKDQYTCNVEFELFQQLYPEHLISPQKRESEDQFITPARKKKWVEATVFTLPLEGNTAGFHADVGKFDDCVSDSNSGPKSSDDQRHKVGENIRLKRKLILLSGYVDYVGTPYADDDAYAHLLEHRKPEVVLVRPAWEVKESSKSKKESELTEHDYNLLLPIDGKGAPLLTYAALKAEEAEGEYQFSCFPAGSKVLMGDWTDKPIEALHEGDDIIGFSLDGRRQLVKAKVEHVHVEKNTVVKVTTDTGRIIYTTPDHKFLRTKKNRYGKIFVGAEIVSVYTPKPVPSAEEQRDWDWLGGILDGEGTCQSSVIICQSDIANPEVHQAILWTLGRLGIEVTTWSNEAHGIHKHADHLTLQGGRSLKIHLLNHAKMFKRKRFEESMWKKSKRIAEHNERIVSIESVGEQTVYNIQSSSGNFVCQGFAVKNCQYLVNPKKSKDVKFTESLILSHVITSEGLPQAGTYRIISVWDCASSANTGSDYSVGCVGFFAIAGPLAGRMFVVEIVRGKFSKYELPHQIAKQAARYRVEKIAIEKSPGVDYMENDIIRELVVCGYPECPIPDWFAVDTHLDAKASRIEGLATLLEQDRLYFLNEIPIISDVVVKELTRFKPRSKRKDDTADSLALLSRYLPTHIELPKNEQERQSRAAEWLKEKHLHDMIYDPSQFIPEPPAPQPQMPTEYEGYPIVKDFDSMLFGS